LPEELGQSFSESSSFLFIILFRQGPLGDRRERLRERGKRKIARADSDFDTARA